MSHWWRLAGVGITGGLILLGSCATEPCACPPVLEGITLVDGNHQVGAAGQALPQPITVRVEQLVPRGGALPGRTVDFLPRPGGGSVNVSSVQTDAQGLAKVIWTLGPDRGEDTLVARLGFMGGTPADSAIVTATAQ